MRLTSRRVEAAEAAAVSLGPVWMWPAAVTAVPTALFEVGWRGSKEGVLGGMERGTMGRAEASPDVADVGTLAIDVKGATRTDTEGVGPEGPGGLVGPVELRV